MDLKTRLENYNRLGKMKITFTQLQSSYIDNSDLSTFGIQLFQMNLHPEDTTDLNFCTPFPAHKFDELFEKVEKPEWDEPAPGYNDNFHEAYGLGQWFSEYLGSHRYDWDLLASRNWEQMTSTLENRFLSDYSRLTQKWRMLTVFIPYPRPKVHTACILVEQATGEDKLLRSEMICAVSLIRGRMQLKEYKEHQIFPVFVYTFAGRKVRIVQVHFDGKYLVVRLTKYLDFEEENVDNVKLLLRWMMNEPLGDTILSSPETESFENQPPHLGKGCQFGQWLDLASLRLS